MTENLLKLFSLAPEPAELENGNTVYLRRLSAADRIAWMDLVASSNEQGRELAVAYDLQASLLCLTLCDEHGKRLFADGDQRAVQAAIDERTFEQLGARAFRINGMGAEARAEIEKKT